MNCRDGTTTFLPFYSRIGGQDRYDCPTVGQFLTREQANIYIQKGGDRGNSEYKQDGAGNRTRETAR